jgi:hypothetical protein
MLISFARTRALTLAVVIGVASFGAGRVAAQATIHQTADVTPLAPASQLPYRLELRPYDMGGAAMPTLHSFTAAHYDGKWILLAGRTNGLHGFEQSGAANFPVQYQNREVWVIDPVAKQSWHRSLEDAAAGVSATLLASLTPSNTQFLQKGDRLYVTGGYGATAGGSFATFSALTAIDLPGLAAWAIGGAGTAAQHFRQTSDPLLTVTGGAMFELGGRVQLIFGHNFQGGYTPGKNGVYTRQVRSFEIVDDGVNLSLANASSTPADDDYRRRDLNVFPVLQPDGMGGTTPGVTVLSGVFTDSNGAWTVPVEIDAAGQPSMADPTAADTFKQGFNGYHAAKLGLYSSASGDMHELLLGGISLQYRDELTGVVHTDDNFPFVNDLTAVTINAVGEYAQRHLGYYPEILDQEGKRLRFGANAEFFAAEGVPTFAGGVIDYDQLGAVTTLGYVFGGIASNSPHVRGVAGAISGASNRTFEVVLVKVPEPSAAMLAAAGVAVAAMRARRERRG